jgi:hypothetical protein
MKKNEIKTNRLPAARAGIFAAAAAAVALLMAGCGGGSSTSSTATWPSTTPPATSETNTYIGTQVPGLYTVTIDHTGNTFSYQDVSTSSATVSGTFTTDASGFLALSTGGYALEQLSRAVLLLPPTVSSGNGEVTPASVPIFAINAPSCQVIPTRTEFEYIAPPDEYFGSITNTAYSGQRSVNSGLVYASTDTKGADWNFGGELQYALGGSSGTATIPDAVSATCSAGSGSSSSLVQSTITVPSSLAANFAIGPTGYFVEDRYASDGISFIGAVKPSSAVDLGQLSGTTFLGTESQAATGPTGVPAVYPPSLVSFTSSASSTLTGGAFPSNDPTQTPAANYTIKLGTQDPVNFGYFPSATITETCTNCTGASQPAYALVTDAGGKLSIFVVMNSGVPTGFVLFQQ